MNIKIPSTFIKAHAHLTWREAEFGLQNCWLTDETLIALAIDRVTAGDYSRDTMDLASVLPNEKYKVRDIVRRLAASDPGYSPEKWLFLLLAWLYEHRDVVEDALGLVEQLYADFDYPDEIASFVRYMPPQDPSRVGNSYLMEAWKRYLDHASRKYLI